jgi:hypothetical protein
MHANYEIDSYKWFSREEAAKNIRPGSLAEHFLVSYLGEPEIGARVFEEPGKWEPAPANDAATVKESAGKDAPGEVK